ncbi:MAG: acetyl-CoA carboxylase biotin carboxyl carrier protein subunit [Rikenellaceae bacterium]|nr:acetyl-CoA carboxylase biotin carboxyl carrier protein subunit [Rikenellaceae bacterium]
MSNKKMSYDKIVTINGTYPTTLNEMYRRRKSWVPANPKHLLSYIPGTVVSIGVKVGQKVEKGEELMVFKAMKMNNRIKSPMDGTIKSILIKKDESVPKGTLMIEFE